MSQFLPDDNNYDDEQFLLFPQCFLLNRVIASQFVHIFHILSLFDAEFEEPKIGISGKGLRMLVYWRVLCCY